MICYQKRKKDQCNICVCKCNKKRVVITPICHVVVLSISLSLGMEDKFVVNENTLNDLSDEIDALNKEMDALLISIQEKEYFYRNCRQVEPK